MLSFLFFFVLLSHNALGASSILALFPKTSAQDQHISEILPSGSNLTIGTG
jgi:hypothetical protein